MVNTMAKKIHDSPHLYERTEVGKKGWVIYRCMLPNCSHYISEALIVGKISLCHGVCGDAVLYTQDDLNQKLKRPMCASCRELRKQQKEEMSKIA